MKAPAVLSRRPSVAAQFQTEIQKHLAEGVPLDALTLKLTLGDANKLKRDPGLALTDISFADGVMKFLGVKVEQGGITVSSLSRT